MSNIDTHISIPKDVATRDDLDFSFLKEKGVEYIAQLGAKLWTDYNTHDPGITMLEMLCYAISDLGMRINLPIEDLLASENLSKDIPAQFYKAKEIFPSKPITGLDYRKLLVDIDGVKNCWLMKYEKEMYVDCKEDEIFYDKSRYDALPDDDELRKKFTLKGLYDILVDFEDEIIDKEDVKDVVKEKIRTRYHQNRNLCEDIVDIKEVETQAISVCASIEVENQADEERIHAEILTAIDNYFSPIIKFYSIQQMMDKGYVTEQIFDGPILDNGFIDSKELEKASIRTEVRLSDIMKLIMNIEGVKYIKEISIGNCGEESFEEENEWLICLKDGKKPVRCKESILNYSKGFLPLNLNQEQVKENLEKLKEERMVYVGEDIPLPKGRFSENDLYTTIQNDFPDTYGIGINGLSARATTERKSQAKQLKGYLLFFDKVLAGYFSHLGKVKEILSVSGQLTNTFFTQAIKDIKGFDGLVNNYETNSDEVLTDVIYREFDNNVERRNQVLDHLLARFAERFGEYTFMMRTLYGSATGEVVLRNKEAFLKDYKIISGERGNAFDYYKQPPENLWDTDNISGTQKRIARLLGIKNYNRRNLSDSYVSIFQDESEKECRALKWEIKNKEGEVLLRATETYITSSSASKEMYFSVLQIIESDLYTLENLFRTKIKKDVEVGNFRISVSPKKKMYSFSIINPEIPESSKDHIIARHPDYYDTQEELKDAIDKLIHFIENDFTEEGLFLIEHILLRPDVHKTTVDQDNFIPICSEACEKCEPLDPYSYRVSIILPGYTFRFSDTDFRNYMENVIKQELPAHVLARICWIGHRKSPPKDDETPEEIEKRKMQEENNGLLQLEKTYKEFLEMKTQNNGSEEEGAAEDTSALERFNTALFSLQTLYPAGRLIDCDDDDETDRQIILGKSNIGSL